MKIREQRKKNIFVLLFVLLCSIGLGYALLQTTLTINGTSKIKGNTWDIHFANLNVTPGSVAIGTGDSAAAIQSSTTDITYTVTLNEPGDFYEFTVDAVNAGTIDGMIESVTSKLNNTVITTLPAYLDYSVTYSDGVAITPNNLLKAGETETYKVRIEFKKDIESTDLPTSVQTLTLDFGVAYIQANNTATEVEHYKYVYTVNKYDGNVTNPKYNAVWLNQAIHETIPYFETPAEALSAIATASSKDLPFYLKHKVENGIVTEQYVEFVVTDAMAQANSGMVPGTYALRGEKTYDDATSTYLVDENYISTYYEANKEVLKTAFGYATNQSRCTEMGPGHYSYFDCHVSNFGADILVSGEVAAYTSEQDCAVSNYGFASCHWD